VGDVTVVIPSYRRPATCRIAVRSALCQTLRPREVVLVVDGEDASGYEHIEAEIDDPALTVIRTGRANGAAGARNIGVRHATTEWIAFLDDDDTFLPRKLERQLAAIGAAGLPRDGRPVISTSAVVATDGRHVERWPGRPPRPTEPVEDFLFGLGPKPSLFRVLSTCTLLVSRSLLLDVPMRGRAYDDWDWQIRASRHATLHHVDEVLTVVALGDEGLTSGTTFAEGKAWLESIRPIISEEAYAAACLTVLGRLAGDKGTLADAARLFAGAVRHGGRPRQLAEFPARVFVRRMRRERHRMQPA
jgi:glycosyltransferase involved in cell wall biosynthesis